MKVTRICPNCGKEFETLDRKEKTTIYCCRECYNQHKGIGVKKYLTCQVCGKECEIELEEEIFNINKIYVRVYCFDTMDIYKENYSKITDWGGEINVKDKTISLVFMEINNEISVKYLKNILFHELHHAYQIYLYDKSILVKPLYEIALKILENSSTQPKSICQLSWLIYFLDKTEIEANMESLYQELKCGENSNVLVQYEEMKQYYDLMEQLKYDEEFKKYVKYMFGIDFKKIMHYIKKRLFHFEDKKKRVLRRLKNEKLTENNYKTIFMRYI